MRILNIAENTASFLQEHCHLCHRTFVQRACCPPGAQPTRSRPEHNPPVKCVAHDGRDSQRNHCRLVVFFQGLEHRGARDVQLQHSPAWTSWVSKNAIGLDVIQHVSQLANPNTVKRCMFASAPRAGKRSNPVGLPKLVDFPRNRSTPGKMFC